MLCAGTQPAGPYAAGAAAIHQGAAGVVPGGVARPWEHRRSACAHVGVMLKFRGCQHFRQRLVCATLSGRPIRIDDIRADDPQSPGLRDFEASFLRLLEKLTNGCVVEINETGGGAHIQARVVDALDARSHGPACPGMLGP